jgi:hypothetical protein
MIIGFVIKSRLGNISTCPALLTIFSYEAPLYELREALKSNPYKLVETDEDEDLLRTVNEGKGAVAFVREGFWYTTLLTESYCNLVLVDVNCRAWKIIPK